MSKSGQYALDQQDKACQKGEQEKDFSNLRPDEIAELDEWLAMVYQQTERDENGPEEHIPTH